MVRSRSDADGIGSFFRWYTKTWIHAVATAALTGLGILTFVHRYFAVLAVAAYVLPPVALYLGDSGPAEHRRSDPARGSPTDGSEQHASTESAVDPGAYTGSTDEPSGSTGSVGESTASAGSTGEPASSTESTDRSNPSWSVASAPTDEALQDVVVTGERAYAVGTDGGVFARDSGDWTAILDDGPGAQSNALHGVDAVEDGGVWFVGEGGAVGRLDPETGRHVDYSAPNEDTSAITDLAVAGRPQDETILLVDGSGRIRRGQYDGTDGAPAWDEPTTPGSGSSVTGIALLDDSVGYACDSNQSVFRTTDGGRSFDRIGIDGADGTLTDVAPIENVECLAAADDGVCHRFDATTWTPSKLGEDALWALSVRDDHWLACSDGGLVYEQRADAQRGGDISDEGATDAGGWRRELTPATIPLHGCSLGVSTAVAVGDEGTVVER